MDQDTSSIQTMIQVDPEIMVSVAWRQSSACVSSPPWYWEAWCFSDDPRLKSFQSPSTAYTRERAQRIHDGIVQSVREKLGLQTDLEQLVALLDKWGVAYSKGETWLTLESQTEKVVGYSGFQTEFTFTVKGAFEKVGIWE